MEELFCWKMEKGSRKGGGEDVVLYSLENLTRFSQNELKLAFLERRPLNRASNIVSERRSNT